MCGAGRSLNNCVQTEHTHVNTFKAESGVHVEVTPLSYPLCKGTACMQANSLTLMHIVKAIHSAAAGHCSMHIQSAKACTAHLHKLTCSYTSC